MIVAITNDEKVAQQLALVWGVIPFVIKRKNLKTAKDILLPGIDAFKKNGFLNKDDKIVFRYNEKVGDSQSPNTITIESVR